MSLLVIQLPARPRLGAREGAEAAVSQPAPAELDYVLSADGQQLTLAGRASPATLPRAHNVIAVVDDADIAWHLVDVPKAPAARLRAALAGVMEERLLEEEHLLHFALAADAGPGQRSWVAVTHKAWLRSTLAALEAAGLEVERVLPASRPARPGEPTLGHFACPQHGDALEAGMPADDQPRLVLARADGVLCAPLGGALARALLPSPETPVRWTATPAAAAAAEAWLGAPVTVQREAERLLALGRRALEPGARSDNLRQFDLVARRRGSRAVSAGFKRLLSPRWRPVRWGLVSLLVVQLLGLNAYAWQQQRALQDKRAAMVQLLRDTHPGVRAVLDAPLQMQRETERLRARAGRTGDADLEALLAAAAAAWPEGQGPVQTLRYESGRLTLGAPGWNPGEVAQFQQRLQGGGYAAQLSGSSITLSRLGWRGRGGQLTPPAQPAASMNTATDRFAATLAPLRLRWQALPPRQQGLLALVAGVVSLLLLWSLAVQPALRTLQQAAVQNDRMEAELQVMQRLAEESRALRATPSVPLEQAAAALQAATERLGPSARLSLQGDRAVLTLDQVGTTALSNWLAEARGGARARPVEASLSRAEQGYSGTLVVTLGGGA